MKWHCTASTVLALAALSGQAPTLPDKPQHHGSAGTLKVFLQVETQPYWKHTQGNPTGHSLLHGQDPWGKTSRQRFEVWLPSSTYNQGTGLRKASPASSELSAEPGAR